MGTSNGSPAGLWRRWVRRRFGGRFRRGFRRRLGCRLGSRFGGGARRRGRRGRRRGRRCDPGRRAWRRPRGRLPSRPSRWREDRRRGRPQIWRRRRRLVARDRRLTGLRWRLGLLRQHDRRRSRAPRALGVQQAWDARVRRAVGAGPDRDTQHEDAGQRREDDSGLASGTTARLGRGRLCGGNRACLDRCGPLWLGSRAGRAWRRFDSRDADPVGDLVGAQRRGRRLVAGGLGWPPAQPAKQVHPDRPVDDAAEPRGRVGRAASRVWIGDPGGDQPRDDDRDHDRDSSDDEDVRFQLGSFLVPGTSVCSHNGRGDATTRSPNRPWRMP